MPEASVTAEVHQTLDVHRDLAAEITFDLEVLVDGFADPANLLLVEVFRLLVAGDPGLGADGLRALRTDSVDVLEGDEEVLPPGEIDAGDTCHDNLSALSLLVTGIFAKNAHDALTAHDLALVANLLDAGSNLHLGLSTSASL
jgi:hypothetical protein